MSRERQLPVLSVSLVKIELPTVIKDESPESEIVEIGIDDIRDSSESEEEIIPEIKNIDIAYHPVCEQSIKSEILQSYHCESVETQVLVNAENSPFTQADNITQRYKTGDTSDENVSKGTGQAVVEIQESESKSEEELISELKDIDIVHHPVCEEAITSEILQSYHCESVETQVLVNAGNSPFIQADNITQRNKTTGDTSHENVSKSIDQAVVEVQGSNKYSNILGNLERKKRLVVYLSRDVNLNDFSIKNNKAKQSKKATVETTSWKKGKEKIKVTKAPVIPVEAHEYTSLAKGSNEYSNVLGNLEREKRLVIYLSRDLHGFSIKNSKAKQPEKTIFFKCCKTVETTSLDKDKEKIKVVKAPVIPVEAHEYTSLANGKRVCNHCQYACNRLDSLKFHIEKMHRKVTTMYQCPYCPYKSKWKSCINQHIILKHKDTKDIEWFQCNLCEKKFKLKSFLTKHKKDHLTLEQMQDGLDLKSYHCEKCNYKTYRLEYLKYHKLVHLKPEEIQYLYCYHCSSKYKRKSTLKNHIFRQHFKIIIQGKRYGCNKCDYKTYTSSSLNNHKLTHLKPEEVQYFYCYHCSYKTKWKGGLRWHIFRHFEKEQVKFDCYICNFVTSKREPIIKHIKTHSKVQNK